MTWSVREKEPNIFFQNLSDTDDTGQLASYVDNELYYFRSFLRKAIDSLDVSKYGMEWDLIKSKKYNLYPQPQIYVFKPKNKIELMINPEMFSNNPNVPIQNGDWEILDKIGYEIKHNSVIITFNENVNLKPDEKILFKGIECNWNQLSSGFEGNFKFLENRIGDKYQILIKREIADRYILNLDEAPKNKEDLFIQGVKIDYELNSLIYPEELFDDNGELIFSIENEFPLIIEVERNINGSLTSSTNRTYTYKKLKQKKENWIKLKDNNFEEISESEGTSKADIFMELIFGAFEFEIWESPNYPAPNQRIRLFKVNSEEATLKLERKPTTNLIFPPRNDYQLKMQQNAINTISYHPSPEHRNLLKLFEPKPYWEKFDDTFSFDNITWKFLTNPEKYPSTKSQKDFVVNAMNTPDFAFLEGPPGSGKTMAITELIYQLIKRGKRILLAASTHVAIDNVLEKLIEDLAGPTTALEDLGIVPLRIGREKSISFDIVQFQEDHRKTYFREIMEEKEPFNLLSQKEKDRFIEQLVINSSNLVCGTVIGILQYPPFKKLKRDFIEPEFDYLIIDEASKTTFQEFLVPAIYAQKWILTGDIKQLSPYTETFHVQLNLDGILNNPNLEKALLVFMKLIFDILPDKPDSFYRKFPRPPRFIYVDHSGVLTELKKVIEEVIEKDEKRDKKEQKYSHRSFSFIVRNQLESSKSQISIYNFHEIRNKSPELLSSDIIFVDEYIFSSLSTYLPASHILINGNKAKIDIQEFRHEYWKNQMKNHHYSCRIKGKYTRDTQKIIDDIYASLANNWAGEVAWRMKRVYELKLMDESPSKTGYYYASLRSLLPPDNSEHNKIWNAINKVIQVSFPSILSSIQEGTTNFHRKEDQQTVLTSGMEKSALRARHILLKYQYRMHPNISEIPRKLFYQNAGALRDVKALQSDRAWSYNRFKNRMVWIHVEAKDFHNTNKTEAKKIQIELDHFLKWAKKQKSRKFSIIILSFYEKQRKFLIEYLNKYYKRKSKYPRIKIDNCLIKVFTVDKVQGREADVVLLSLVRNRKIGFMDTPNRLNVAITRAKFLLVIFGNYDFFNDTTDEFSMITETLKKQKSVIRSEH